MWYCFVNTNVCEIEHDRSVHSAHYNLNIENTNNLRIIRFACHSKVRFTPKTATADLYAVLTIHAGFMSFRAENIELCIIYR